MRWVALEQPSNPELEAKCLKGLEHAWFQGIRSVVKGQLAGKESFAAPLADVASVVSGFPFAIGAIPLQRTVRAGAEIEVVVVLDPLLATLKGGASRPISAPTDITLIRLDCLPEFPELTEVELAPGVGYIIRVAEFFSIVHL